MRGILLPFMLGMLCSCGGIAEELVDSVPRVEGHERAEEIVNATFEEAGYRMALPTAVLWTKNECLGPPWSLGYDDCDPLAHDCHCLNGRALWLGWGCVAAVRWRDTVISDTSFAHELAWHCGQGDFWHWLPLYPVVDEANDRLREEGL